MKITYHVVPFTCGTCGRKMTILEFAARADGLNCLGGICVMCGTYGTHEYSAAQLIAASALMDRQDEIRKNPIELLEDYELVGKPS